MLRSALIENVIKWRNGVNCITGGSMSLMDALKMEVSPVIPIESARRPWRMSIFCSHCELNVTVRASGRIVAPYKDYYSYLG